MPLRWDIIHCRDPREKNSLVRNKCSLNAFAPRCPRAIALISIKSSPARRNRKYTIILRARLPFLLLLANPRLFEVKQTRNSEMEEKKNRRTQCKDVTKCYSSSHFEMILIKIKAERIQWHLVLDIQKIVETAVSNDAINGNALWLVMSICILSTSKSR